MRSIDAKKDRLLNRSHTVANLWDRFRNSAEFAILSVHTRKFYTYGMRDVCAVFGERIFKNLHQAELTQLQIFLSSDALVNRALASLRRMDSWAFCRQYTLARSFVGLTLLPRTGRHVSWSPAELALMRAEAKGFVRRLFIFAHYSAQRRSDLLNARWENVQGEIWSLKQTKTRMRLRLPLPYSIQSQLQVTPIRKGPILVDCHGSKLGEGAIAYRWRNTLRQLNIQGKTLHGLRVTRAVELAEAGCTIHQIAALTGHKSLKMIQHYTQDAQQYRLACDAISLAEIQ